MKRLLPSLLALGLAACSSPAPAYTYDASGTWAVEAHSTSETAWHPAGTLQLTQGEGAALTGTFVGTDGTTHNTVQGNARSGELSILGGAEVQRVTGAFTGDTYTGTYTYGTVDSGAIRMTR